VYDDQARWAQVASATDARPAFVGVDDAEALACQMRRLVDDLHWRESLKDAGLAYSATFKPQATAAALGEAFKAAAG
jgi:hypothetical protein